MTTRPQLELSTRIALHLPKRTGRTISQHVWLVVDTKSRYLAFHMAIQAYIVEAIMDSLVITSTNPNSTGQRKRLEDGKSSYDAKGVCRTKLIPTQVVYV